MDEEDCSFDKINEPYFFESDHVALKENSDYRGLLHTIALLEAQRQQAAEDIETLYKAKDAALADPLNFVKRLQKGDNLGIGFVVVIFIFVIVMLSKSHFYYQR